MTKDGRHVGWEHYKTGSVDWTRDWQFMDWLAEYRHRVRPDEAQRVHRGFGYLAPRVINKCEDLGFCGEGIAHPKDCSCKECDDWERVLETAGLRPRVNLFGIPSW